MAGYTTDRRHTERKQRWARTTLMEVLHGGLPDAKRVPAELTDLGLDFDMRWGNVLAFYDTTVRGRKVRITLEEVPE